MKTVCLKNSPTFFLNKDFQTIQIKVIFPFKYDEKKIAMMHLLPGMLHNVSNKYPTEKEMSQYTRSICVLSCFCTCNTMGDIGYFTFNFMVPDIKSLKEDYLDEQLRFLRDVMYDPKLEEDGFCSQELEREKDNLRVDIEKVLKDTGSYAMIKAKSVVDPLGRFSSTIYNHTNQIDKVNTKNLYGYYKEVIYNNHPFIYIFGNIEKKKIINLTKKYLYRTSFENTYLSAEIKKYLPIRNTITKKCDKSDFNNSVSVMFYKVKDMSFKDELMLGIVRELLSSLSSRLLSIKLRDEYELVYSSFASSFCNYGLLAIIAFIQKDNISLVQDKVKEVILSLKNEKEILPLLENIKDRHRINLIRQKDDKLALFEEYIIKDLGIEPTSIENYQELIKITPKDVSTFIDRLVLDTLYFLKEGNHE